MCDRKIALPHHCVCSQWDDRREPGGGWSCGPCREFVERITTIIREKIADERGTAYDDEKRKAYSKDYYRRNRTALLAYNREYQQGLRLKPEHRSNFKFGSTLQ